MKGISKYFIDGEVFESDNSVAESYEALSELKKESNNELVRLQYKLGENIANGIKYFGQEKIVKKRRTAMCICPKCGELWRVGLSVVARGHSKSCGCKEKKDDM